ncbi:hypothetical protein UlMin_033581 [Ulmus minor]
MYLTRRNVKTTNPKKYCVRPNTGVILPRSTCDVIVTVQAQKEAHSDMQCKDKFLLQSVKVNDGTNTKDINAEMLRVVYIFPPQPPSSVEKGSEEGSSPRGSISKNGHVNGIEFSNLKRDAAEKINIIAKLAAEVYINPETILYHCHKFILLLLVLLFSDCLIFFFLLIFFM